MGCKIESYKVSDRNQDSFCKKNLLRVVTIACTVMYVATCDEARVKLAVRSADTLMPGMNGMSCSCDSTDPGTDNVISEPVG